MYQDVLNSFKTNNLQCRSNLHTTKKYISNNGSTSTELHTQHIYSHDLPLGLIPLVVDHKIDHKYPIH